MISDVIIVRQRHRSVSLTASPFRFPSSLMTSLSRHEPPRHQSDVTWRHDVLIKNVPESIFRERVDEEEDNVHRSRGSVLECGPPRAAVARRRCCSPEELTMVMMGKNLRLRAWGSGYFSRILFVSPRPLCARLEHSPSGERKRRYHLFFSPSPLWR